MPKDARMTSTSLDRQALLSTFVLVVDEEEESIAMVTGYSTTKDCVGIFNYTACTLKSAIGEYDVTVDRGQVTLDSPGHPIILALANNTDSYDEATDSNERTHYSTLAGIVSPSSSFHPSRNI